MSRNQAESHLRQVSSFIKGVLFLGTPDHGAKLVAWGPFGISLAMIVKLANSDIVSVLRPRSEMFARIQSKFYSLLRLRRNEGAEIDITCFYEELPLPVVESVRRYAHISFEICLIIPKLLRWTLQSYLVMQATASTQIMWQVIPFTIYLMKLPAQDMTKLESEDDAGYEFIAAELRIRVKGSQLAHGIVHI